MKIYDAIVEFFWNMLPDRCQGHDCPRKGVRGNENIIAGIILCDDCTVRFLK